MDDTLIGPEREREREREVKKRNLESYKWWYEKIL